MANLLGAIGNAQPVSQFIDTALKYQTVQSNLETQRMQQQKLRDEEIQRKKDMTEYDPESVVSLHPKQYQDIVRSALAPYRDPNTGLVQGVHARNVPKYIKENVELHTALLTSEHQQLTKDNMKLAESQIPADKDQLAKNFKRQADIAKELRLGKDKETTLIPEKTIGTMTGGVVTPLPEEIRSKPKVAETLSNPNGDIVTRTDSGELLNPDGSTYEGHPGDLIKIGKSDEPKEPTSLDATWLLDWNKDHPDATPSQRRTAIEKYKKEQIEWRGEGFGRSRPINVVDTKTGRPTTISLTTMEEMNAREPGRFEPAQYSPEFKSDSGSLANITKGMDTVMAFKKGVKESLSLVSTIQDKIKRSNIPGVNRISQYIAYNIGDPDVKAFRNALTTAMTEYMKVTTAGTGISVAELTQGAQERAKNLLEISDNENTFNASIAIMNQEMDIKERAFNAQREEIKRRMKPGGVEGNATTPSAPSGPVKVWNPATKTFDVRQ